MNNLAEVLSRARTFWEAKGVSSRMMPLRAERCAELLYDRNTWGIVDSFQACDGTLLLGDLAKEGLARKTQGEYYAAFRRALALSGISTIDWPKAPVAPRKVREPISPGTVDWALAWLHAKKWHETACLAEALLATGMRVEVEALSPDAITYGETSLKVIGKGGHERMIPVTNSALVYGWLEQARKVPYATHLDRWNKAVAECGVQSKMPTFHAIRHLYATQAYHRSGKNLRVVQELLGHANIATTAGYIGVDLEELRHAAGA